jgi:hypothetical protein
MKSHSWNNEYQTFRGGSTKDHAMTLSGYGSVYRNDGPADAEWVPKTPRPLRCAGRGTNGGRCTQLPQDGSQWCKAHDPVVIAEKASRRQERRLQAFRNRRNPAAGVVRSSSANRKPN